MRIIISPAKKMNIHTDDLGYRDLPEFLPQAEQLLVRLRSMSYDELKKLWNCSSLIMASFRACSYLLPLQQCVTSQEQ